MKRFYCTICKRVKRVRSLPRNVVAVNCEVPEDRTGTCDKHSVDYVPVAIKLANLKNTLRKAN